MTPLTWALILFVLSAAFFILEIVIPSGGILGVLSVASVVAANVNLFLHSTEAGMLGVMITLVLIPVSVMVAFKVFPHTPIGRALTLHDAQPAGSVQYDKARDVDPQSLVGAEGQAETTLHPVGICLIGDRRLECLSDAGVIEAGTSVCVSAVRGIEVRVRPI